MFYLSRKLLLLLSLFILPAGLGSAAVLNWTGSAGEPWTTAAPWSAGVVPSAADSVWFNTDSTSCTINSADDIFLQELIVGRYANDVELKMDGGALTTTANIVFVGQYATADAKLILQNGAVLTSFSEVSIGISGAGQLEMDAATIVAGGTFSIGRYAGVATAIGSVVMKSGTITCGDFNMNENSSFDFQHGTLTIDGNRVSRVAGFLASGQLFSSLAASDQDFQIDYDVTAPGKTTIVAPGYSIYISPTGSAAGDGSIDSPLSTLEDARDHLAARGLSGGQTVYLRGGRYQRTSTFEIQASDFAGTPPPIHFRAYPGELPIIAATVTLSAADASTPTDPATVNRIRPEALAHVVEYDLAALGVVNTNEFPVKFKDHGNIIELFANSAREPIARYPNDDGVMTMKRVLANGSNSAGDVGIFEYRDARHATWATAMAAGHPVWLKGYYRVVWQFDALKVASIDPVAETVTFQTGINNGIGSKFHRPEGSGEEPYWIENMLEEIDQPGEWSLDFLNKKLHYYPSAPLAELILEVSDLSAPVIHMNDVSGVQWEGIQFLGGLKNAILITGGSGNTVKGCELTLTNKASIFVDGGSHHLIQSCDIHHIGAGGITLQGGTVDPLVDCHHRATNNHIHHFCINDLVYGGAVDAGYQTICVGAQVDHNLIHDTPHVGILFGSYRNVIEHNHITRYSLVSNDMGGIYSFIHVDRLGGAGDNIIRYNLVHDAPNGDGIYMDFGDPGPSQVYGNIVANVNIAYLYKDPDNDHDIHDNIAINSGVGFQIPLTPGSIFERNYAFNNSLLDMNLKNATTAQINDNPAATQAPGFIDPAGENFTLPQNSPVYALYPGFQAADGALFGLYQDEYRIISADHPQMIPVGNTLEFHFKSKSSQSYQLESATNLDNWLAEDGPFIGTGTDGIITIEPVPTDRQRFYRFGVRLR